MTLLETLNKDIISAMKAKEAEKLTTLRALKSAIVKESQVTGIALDETGENKVVIKEINMRNKEIAEYVKVGREDLADNIKKEIAIIELYAPKGFSDDEVKAIVEKTIANYDNKDNLTMKDMRPLMDSVKAETKGLADGKFISELIRKAIQG